MWLIGVPWAEAQAAGSLMGTKAILNEYVAYLELAALPDGTFAPRSLLIVTYALCGVANLASIGLLVSTIGTLTLTEPGRDKLRRSGGLVALIDVLLSATSEKLQEVTCQVLANMCEDATDDWRQMAENGVRSRFPAPPSFAPTAADCATLRGCRSSAGMRVRRPTLVKSVLSAGVPL